MVRSCFTLNIGFEIASGELNKGDILKTQDGAEFLIHHIEKTSESVKYYAHNLKMSDRIIITTEETLILIKSKRNE